MSVPLQYILYLASQVISVLYTIYAHNPVQLIVFWFTMPPKGGGQRSLARQINDYADLDSNDLFTFVEGLKRDQLDGAGFRWQATTTQSRQNCKLNNYTAFCRKILKILPDDDDEYESLLQKDKDVVLFPQDHDELYKQIGLFLIFVAQIAHGKSQARITYTTLMQYREAMMFWAFRACDEHKFVDIPKGRFFRKLTESMRIAAMRYNLPVFGKRRATQIGLAELRRMIDLDMVRTPNLPFAESHHLAWCIGRITAARPGSIAASTKEAREKNKHLLWRDIELTKDVEDGKFSARITFRALKTNRQDPEQNVQKGQKNMEVQCNIKSPQSATNFIFSIPHRLLVIALRRGYLKDITTLDELFEYGLHHIQVSHPHHPSHGFSIFFHCSC